MLYAHTLDIGHWFSVGLFHGYKLTVSYRNYCGMSHDSSEVVVIFSFAYSTSLFNPPVFRNRFRNYFHHKNYIETIAYNLLRSASVILLAITNENSVTFQNV